jgi:hypothetical protein
MQQRSRQPGADASKFTTPRQTGMRLRCISRLGAKPAGQAKTGTAADEDSCIVTVSPVIGVGARIFGERAGEAIGFTQAAASLEPA